MKKFRIQIDFLISFFFSTTTNDAAIFQSSRFNHYKNYNWKMSKGRKKNMSRIGFVMRSSNVSNKQKSQKVESSSLTYLLKFRHN